MSSANSSEEHLRNDSYIPQQQVFLIINIVIIIPILFGNILVIAAVAKFEHLRTATNMIISSLALSDLLVGATAPYFSVIHYTNLGLNRNKYACLLSFTLMMLPCGLSLGNLVAVSIDRFISIQKPLRYTSIITLNRTIAGLVVLWVYGFLIFLLPVLGWNNWKPECECGIAIVLTKSFLLLIITHLLLFLILTGILYARVFYIAWKTQKLINTQTMGIKDMRGQDYQQAKISRVMAYVLGIFYACWMPFFLLTPIRMFTPKPEPVWLRILYQFILCLAFSNSCMNPLIYARRNDDFRRAFSKMLGLKLFEQNSTGPWTVDIPLPRTRTESTSSSRKSSDKSINTVSTEESLVDMGDNPAELTCSPAMFLSQPYKPNKDNPAVSSDVNTLHS